MGTGNGRMGMGTGQGTRMGTGKWGWDGDGNRNRTGNGEMGQGMEMGMEEMGTGMGNGNGEMTGNGEKERDWERRWEQETGKCQERGKNKRARGEKADGEMSGNGAKTEMERKRGTEAGGGDSPGARATFLHPRGHLSSLPARFSRFFSHFFPVFYHFLRSLSALPPARCLNRAGPLRACAAPPPPPHYWFSPPPPPTPLPAVVSPAPCVTASASRPPRGPGALVPGGAEPLR